MTCWPNRSIAGSHRCSGYPVRKTLVWGAKCFPLRFRGSDEVWGLGKRPGERCIGAHATRRTCPPTPRKVTGRRKPATRIQAAHGHFGGPSYFFLFDRDGASDPRFVEGCAQRAVGEREPARIDLGTTVLRVMLTSSECSRCGDRGTEEQCVCTSNYVGIECWLTLLSSSCSSPTVALRQSFTLRQEHDSPLSCQAALCPRLSRASHVQISNLLT